MLTSQEYYAIYSQALGIGVILGVIVNVLRVIARRGR